MFGSQLVGKEKKRNNVKHVKIGIPLYVLEIREKRRFLPNWLWHKLPKKWSSSPVAKYYVGLSGYFLEKKEKNGVITLEPTGDFDVFYMEIKKDDDFNGYKRFRKFSFSRDAGKKSTRDFIDDFWKRVKESIREAHDRKGRYLIEMRHVFLLNPDEEYQGMLQEMGVTPEHTEIYNSNVEKLGIYQEKKIFDKKSHDVSGYHAAFPIDVVEYMLATRKEIPISYITN